MVRASTWRTTGVPLTESQFMNQTNVEFDFFDGNVHGCGDTTP
jgi:hypothetical protein